MNRTVSIIFISISILCLAVPGWGARVEKDGGQVFIIDQHGERWNVTRAETLGFAPEKFQYGIGRHAFQTLDDSHFAENNRWVYRNMRVIGIAGGEEAQAFSVRKLVRHEIANTSIAGEAITVGY